MAVITPNVFDRLQFNIKEFTFRSGWHVFGGMLLGLGLTGSPVSAAEFAVAGSSMDPTLNSGDTIQVEEGYYKSHPVVKGVLVALKFQPHEHPMVKRVVAISGDLVQIKNASLAHAEFITLTKDNPTGIGASEIGSNASGVRISVRSRALRDVLQRIQNETGVTFKLYDTMLGTPVTASIQAADWKTAIIELLESFNMMTVWGKTLDQSRIRILGLDGNAVNVTSAPVVTNPNPVPESPVPVGKASPVQSKSYKVSGTSMQPTLNSGDHVQVEEGYYQNNPVLRGDLVALKFQSRNRPMVKRVVAVSGDSVELKNGKFWINGQSPSEPWLKNRSFAQSKLKVLTIQLKRYGNRIPNGQLIVMGDNEKNSFDSGDYGMISTSQLSGRVQR